MHAAGEGEAQPCPSPCLCTDAACWLQQPPLLIYTIVGGQSEAARDGNGTGCPCPFPLPHRTAAQPALTNGPFHFSAARGAAPEES